MKGYHGQGILKKKAVNETGGGLSHSFRGLARDHHGGEGLTVGRQAWRWSSG